MTNQDRFDTIDPADDGPEWAWGPTYRMNEWPRQVDELTTPPNRRWQPQLDGVALRDEIKLIRLHLTREVKAELDALIDLPTSASYIVKGATDDQET